MPPSPAMRCSPRRDLRAELHKRGRSLESGILFKEKDDDLALFNEVQKREKDNFLLQSNDDFEDMFSMKLRYLSDCKLELSVPVRGESSELLNADGEKNDYDWLLTPPDTPLFRSLDDETPPLNLAQRGRPRSQPISISRSSTMEKSYRSSRGSASPNRLSPSPRSGNSVFQSRGRPSSVPLSSPTPSLQHTALSRRASPPPSKPSTPVPRSSTPTPRRVSTGSGANVSSSRVRGTSPVKTSRGNSMSPKIRAWQSNFSGFSSEAPPNLRTSVADRPASYVRGSSPVSRNGRGSSPGSRNGKDLSSGSGRQSMSPTACRSISSLHSPDRERFRSHSKGSVASSGDDDIDSLQSIAVISSDHLVSGSVGKFRNKKTLASSKKPARIVSSSSAPKRSFDLAMRQMDHRKGPQNMFRPLLSSVPSSTFYVGKASAAHRPMISMNSSVTTSSNASSDQGTSAAHDTEGSDQNHEGVNSGFVRPPDPDIQDEVFAFDNTDTLKEDVGLEIHERSASSPCGECNGKPTVESQLDDSENFSRHGSTMAIATALEDLDVEADVSGLKDMVLCCKCGCKYHAIESVEGDLKVCPDCSRSNVALTIPTPVSTTVVTENSSNASARISEEHDSNDALEPLMGIPEFPEVTSMGTIRTGQHEKFVKGSQNPYGQPSWNSLSENSLAPPLVDEGEKRLANEQVIGQPTVCCSISEGAGPPEMLHFSDHLHTKVCVSEGAGISVLLKRSGSVKGPIVQSRTFTATTVPHDDLSYVRDPTNSMRSSLGHSSGSALSSVDLISARQIETRVQWQLSGRKAGIDSYRYDIHTEYHHVGSLVPGNSSHAFQAIGLPNGTDDQSFDLSGAHMEKDIMEGTCVAPHEELLASENAGVDETCANVEGNNSCWTMAAPISELSSHMLNIHSGDISVTSFSNSQESVSYGNGEKLMNNSCKIFDIQASAMTTESSPVDEEGMPNSWVDRVGAAEVPSPGSLDKISEMEVENGHLGSPGSQSDVPSPNSKASIDELRVPSLPTASDMDTTALIAEYDSSDRAHGILEESTVMVGEQGGMKARSLTLEEATDTILFCSSIVQSLAYEAATIVMEKEISVPLEGSWPTVTILGKSNSDKRNPNGRMARKRNFKSQKAKQRPVETDTKPPLDNTEVDEKADISTTRIVGASNKGDDSMKPPKLESKCNCTIM